MTSERRAELSKLKVSELKVLAVNASSSIKKKSDLIDYILKKEDGKRAKIAPVFAMSKSSSSSCELCDGQNSVWSELGIALCPVCCKDTPGCQLPSPSVKQEPGVTRLKYKTDIDGKIVIDIGTVDPKKLISLVTVYGFGLCESIEALSEFDSVEQATDFLVNRNRSSAENASIAEAQLNSEQVREETKASRTKSQNKARESVVDDISVLLDIDKDFCSVFLFADGELPGNGRVLNWVIEEAGNRILLFDYLVIRRDSIKWYKKDAAAYFQTVEREDLMKMETCDISRWFTKKIEDVTMAVFGIPITGGSIPEIFRQSTCQEETERDSDVEVVSSKSNCSDSPRNIVLLE
jgi:hypothetical protein